MYVNENLLTGIMLAALLTSAAWNDVRSYRIPNLISLGGALVGFAFLCTQQGMHGAFESITGWVTGLLVLLPLYALRIMGAGDIKLLAMTGAFVGAPEVLVVTLYVLVAGGVFALLTAVAQGSLKQALNNATVFAARAGTPGRSETLSELVQETPVSGKLPYAIPILIGTLAWWAIHTA